MNQQTHYEIEDLYCDGTWRSPDDENRHNFNSLDEARAYAKGFDLTPETYRIVCVETTRTVCP